MEPNKDQSDAINKLKSLESSKQQIEALGTNHYLPKFIPILSKTDSLSKFQRETVQGSGKRKKWNQNFDGIWIKLAVFDTLFRKKRIYSDDRRFKYRIDNNIVA